VFSQTARIYDVVYGFKDYSGEAARVSSLIAERAPAARSLLDAACGTGRHLEHLAQSWDAEGLDVDPELLRVARARLPGVTLHEADLVDFDLGTTYDAVTCLFSSIGYMRRPHYLRRAVDRLAAHLAPGGVLIIEPWLSPEAYVVGHHSVHVAQGDGMSIARVAVAEREGDLSRMDMNYLIATDDGVEHLVERHELGLFTHAHYSGALEAAGLTVEHDPEGLIGRGLYIATRPPDPVVD